MKVTSDHPAKPQEAAEADPLQPRHYEAIAQAKVRRAKLRTAEGVAGFSAWSTAVFAALTWPFAPFSTTALAMAVGLTVIAWREFEGRKLLRRLDERGPAHLATNQLIFGALIITYATWQIVVTLTGPSPYEQYIAKTPELGPMLGDMDGLIHTLTLLVYAVVIVGTIAFQGGMAWYYHTRSRHLREYLASTPKWVTALHRPAA